MGIEVLGRVSPIHMIGESHTLAFSDLLFRPSWSDDTFVCRSRYIPTVLASQYSEQGSLNPVLAEALKADSIVDRYLRPYFLYLHGSVSYLTGLPQIAPPMVFFAGDTDLVGLIRQIGDTYDFELPDDPGYGVDRSKQPIAYADVRNQVAKIVMPVVGAVQQLQAVGFSRLMIHCLPPRTANNALANEWNEGMDVSAALRSKLVVLANRLLKAACAESGLAFIDTWPETAENGFLRAEFDLDGLHVNRRAALVSLDKIAAHLFDDRRAISNPLRYAAAQAQADRYLDGGEQGESWQSCGFADGKLDPEDLARIADQLSCLPHSVAGAPNSLARPDWIGWPRSGRDGAVLPEPDESLLASAVSIFGQGHCRSLLHAGAECELSISSFRPLRFAPAAVSASDTLAAPPGGRRALLCLAASDRIVFEALDGQDARPPSLADNGAMVVFDPRRWRYRINSGEKELPVIEISLMPRLAGQPFRVVWAGLCDWPADPFQYSVRGMRAFPAFGGESFSQRG